MQMGKVFKTLEAYLIKEPVTALYFQFALAIVHDCCCLTLSLLATT